MPQIRLVRLPTGHDEFPLYQFQQSHLHKKGSVFNSLQQEVRALFTIDLGRFLQKTKYPQLLKVFVVYMTQNEIIMLSSSFRTLYVYLLKIKSNIKNFK